MTQFVDLSADGTRIIAWYAGPQNVTDHPHFAELADDDARILAFDLGQAQAAQTAAVKNSCAAAISAGFTSSALGSAASYGSQTEDQANIAAAAASANGGVLWCGNSASAWSLTAHTQAQAEQVRADLWTHIQAQQATYAKLLGEIAAATTVAAVEAVVWA